LGTIAENCPWAGGGRSNPTKKSVENVEGGKCLVGSAAMKVAL
jgi:hypothetical protein